MPNIGTSFFVSYKKCPLSVPLDVPLSVPLDVPLSVPLDVPQNVPWNVPHIALYYSKIRQKSK